MDEAMQPRMQEQSVDERREQAASADDQEVPEALEAPESVEVEAPTGRRRKKRVKRTRLVTEEELMPRPSLWPFALAVSVAIMLGGFVINPIVLGIGVILIIASIIGWNLERR
ncbi:MAG: cytochrome c oxidase subunit 4 [Chloroflexota bacterium]|nr:cytochrome c oxidase subunit 4 [Chloroflexota bacterium]